MLVPIREEKEEVMRSLVKVPYFVSEDGIQPRAVEQSDDISEVVGEPVWKVFFSRISFLVVLCRG